MNVETANSVRSHVIAAFVSLVFGVLAFAIGAEAQSSSEMLVTADNAYNPIPSPDGRYIGYVRTGWGEKQWIGFARSSLVSDVKLVNAEGAAAPRTLAKDYFLSGWTPDGAQLVCYRDWKYALVTTDGKQNLHGRIPNDPNHDATEWIAYAPSLATVVWSRPVDNSHRAIETPSRTIVREKVFRPERVVPSPDGRYLAVFGEFQTDLRIYDLRTESWTDLGRMSIHPDQNWWYIQPHWSPWFADGSRLVFLRDSTLVISTPDGAEKTEIKIDGPAGLPVPSPDGQSVAYVTFEPRPMKARPDLQFWGGTTLWVISASAGASPRKVNAKNQDEVYDLKWLNNDTLVFDRIADTNFYEQARIWRVAVPR